MSFLKNFLFNRSTFLFDRYDRGQNLEENINQNSNLDLENSQPSYKAHLENPIHIIEGQINKLIKINFSPLPDSKEEIYLQQNEISVCLRKIIFFLDIVLDSGLNMKELKKSNLFICYTERSETGSSQYWEIISKLFPELLSVKFLNTTTYNIKLKTFGEKALAWILISILENSFKDFWAEFYKRKIDKKYYLQDSLVVKHRYEILNIVDNLTKLMMLFISSNLLVYKDYLQFKMMTKNNVLNKGQEYIVKSKDSQENLIFELMKNKEKNENLYSTLISTITPRTPIKIENGGTSNIQDKSTNTDILNFPKSKNSVTFDSLINLIKEEPNFILEENPNLIDDYHENLQPYEYVQNLDSKRVENKKINKSKAFKNYKTRSINEKINSGSKLDQDRENEKFCYNNDVLQAYDYGSQYSESNSSIISAKAEFTKLERKRRILHDEAKMRKKMPHKYRLHKILDFSACFKPNYFAFRVKGKQEEIEKTKGSSFDLSFNSNYLIKPQSITKNSENYSSMQKLDYFPFEIFFKIIKKFNPHKFSKNDVIYVKNRQATMTNSFIFYLNHFFRKFDYFKFNTDCGKNQKPMTIQSQNGQCQICRKIFIKYYEIFLNKIYWCAYINGFVCGDCISKEFCVLPSMVIKQWDFSKFSISKKAQRILEKWYDKPIIYIKTSDILLKISSSFRAATILKRKIHKIFDLMKCENSEEFVFRVLKEYHYLVIKEIIFSLKDLWEIKSDVFIHKLLEFLKIFENHILKECKVCDYKGSLCMMCLSNDTLYAYDVENVLYCNDCKKMFHRKCSEFHPCYINRIDI